MNPPYYYAVVLGGWLVAGPGGITFISDVEHRYPPVPVSLDMTTGPKGRPHAQSDGQQPVGGPVQSISDEPATVRRAGFDQVDTTVFAPPVVSCGDAFMVQVFAHMPQHAQQARELAEEFDEYAQRRGFQHLATEVARGAQLTFALVVPGLHVDDPVQSMTWTGRPGSVQFAVRVPSEFPSGAAIGTLTVSQRSVPIGHIKFKLSVSSASAGESIQQTEPVGEIAQRYSKAFVSYASKDRDKVLERVQMLRTVGIRYFQDILDLGPGDRWAQQLFKHIDECDLFLLFWSEAAKESPWVLKEVQYALQRNVGVGANPVEIRPIILEGPPIVAPPDELSHLHFNDPLVYLMTHQAR